MRLSLIIALLLTTTFVQAHLADVPAVEHAAEHAWLALLGLPAIAAIVMPMLRRKRD